MVGRMFSPVKLYFSSMVMLKPPRVMSETVVLAMVTFLAGMVNAHVPLSVSRSV